MVKLCDIHLILYDDHAGHFPMNICNQLYKIWITSSGSVYTASFVIVPVNRTIGMTSLTSPVCGCAIGATNVPITFEAGLIVSIRETSAVSYTNYNKKRETRYYEMTVFRIKL